ncbi:ABC transporter substrate-binding protein [Rhodococcus sp. IEGM1428]|uniref:ABC transporter substrate-binding protein n=1 Tax=Rhodococcus sp. IEGM1428 TaxID=3392191 RepID=UPI003D115C02
MISKRTTVTMGVILSLAVLASCADASQQEEPITPADLILTTPPGSTPVDHVTWGLPSGEPTSLDPIKIGDDASNTVESNLCENVMRLEPDFSVAPNLANSAQWVDDTTFVIDLRPNIRFWDGTTATAEDLAYSMSRNLDPEGESVYSSAYTNVVTVDASGPNEVTVQFSAHDSQFLNALASPAGALQQRQYVEDEGESVGTPDGGLMCTGPFELDYWRPGDKIATKANEDYWQGIVPKVANLDFEFIPDDSTLTTALASGEVDGAYTIPNASINILRGSNKGSVYFGPGTASLSFGPTTSEGPAADPVVREALDLAIDKRQYIATALGGYGEPLATFTPPFAFAGMDAADVYQEGYDALEPGRYDLDEAKRLMSTVSLDRTDLVYAVQAGQQASLTAATIVQSAARAIGLNISIRQMQATDFANLFYSPEARDGIDFVGTIGYVDTPGVLTYATEFARPEGLYNWSGYDDPVVTEDLAAARMARDPQESAREFVSAQARFAKARLQVSLAQQFSTLYLNDDLTGATVSIAYINSPWALNLGGK